MSLIRRWVTGVLVVAFAAACGGRFEAVDATGKTGQALAVHEGTFRDEVSICEAVRAISSKEQAKALAATCAERAKQVGRWEAIVRALVAYSTHLSKLASRDDVTVTDSVNGAMAAMSNAEWTALTTDQNAAVSAFAGALTTALSARYRSAVLDKTIKDTEPALQNVLKLTMGEVNLRLKDIDLSRKQIDDAGFVLAAAPADAGAPPPATWAPGLYILREHLVSSRARYVALHGSLEAFSKAHDALGRNAGKLDTKEVTAEVVDVVKSAYAAASALNAKP